MHGVTHRPDVCVCVCVCVCVGGVRGEREKEEGVCFVGVGLRVCVYV